MWPTGGLDAPGWPSTASSAPERERTKQGCIASHGIGGFPEDPLAGDHDRDSAGRLYESEDLFVEHTGGSAE